MIGEKFGMLAVVEMLGTMVYGGKKRGMVMCKCDCGKDKICMVESIKKGKLKSCGCLSVTAPTKHGAYYTPEYGTWRAMKNRCYNEKNKRFYDYGGRGIRVCARWNSFENFLSDMGVRPSSEHSLERNDNDGNYEPSNCYWATKEVQQNNKRSTRFLEYNGEKHSVAQWSRILNLKHYSDILGKLKKGKSFKQVIEFYKNKTSTHG